MIRRTILRSAFFSLALALTLPFVSTIASTQAKAANADPAAEQFVADVSQKAIALLSNKSLSHAKLEVSFGQLLNDNAAMDKIAIFALGQFKRLPNDAQRTEYLALFRKFVTKIYVVRLQDYHDEKLKITGSGPAKGGSMVQSQINFTNGRQALEISWWLFNEGGAYKVFDVNVQGIWLAQEQRSAFASVINNNNGNFDALLSHLRGQIANPTAAAN